MAKNIIPYEDNTSEIIRADLLKYGFINKRNKLRKNRASAAKRQKYEYLLVCSIIITL